MRIDNVIIEDWSGLIYIGFGGRWLRDQQIAASTNDPLLAQRDRLITQIHRSRIAKSVDLVTS